VSAQIHEEIERQLNLSAQIHEEIERQLNLSTQIHKEIERQLNLDNDCSFISEFFSSNLMTEKTKIELVSTKLTFFQ
jgi:hypothetical protein